MKHTFLPALMCAAGLFAAEPRKTMDVGFEEAAGAFSADLSGSRLIAELSPSAKWAVGPFGAALATGAPGACAVVGKVPGLDGADACTVFMRFRRENDGSGDYPCLLTTEDWGRGGILFFVHKDALTVRYRAAPNGPESGLLAFAKIPTGKWCSVAFVFNRPDVAVYADGRCVAKGKWDHPMRAESVKIGSWNGASSFGGFIDDVRVWDGAISAEAIAEMAGDSRYDEIEGYQDDGTGGVAKIEIVEPGARVAATFENFGVALAFDELGAICSLREKASGRELVTNRVPFASVLAGPGRRRLPVRSVARRGDDRLVWTFPFDAGELEMRVVPFDGGWAFKVERCTVKDVAQISFGRVAPACAKWRGTFANAMSDERSAVCVRSADIVGCPRIAGGTLEVVADGAPAGRAALLAAGPRADFRDRLKAMTVAAGVPRSDCGGAWSMDSEVARWSYVFANVRNGDIDYWIDFVRRAGFSNIHLDSSWTDCLGHCPVNRRQFPGGLDEMKACAARARAAGLHVGMHTLTACINPRDPWISPVCSSNLVADAEYTLAAPLALDAKELLVNERPSPRHSTVFTYSSNGNVLRIGGELLQYTGVRDEGRPPYAFTGLRRGAFGTRRIARTLPTGTAVDYLHQRYIAFYPKPDSPLADALADRLAEVYNVCGLDEFYFDGSEGMGTRYGIDAMRHKIYSRLKPNNGHSPSIEASCGGANNWWFQTRMATTDHAVWGMKRFQDFHVAWGVREGRTCNFLEPQMGWWAPRTDVPMARGHFLDEMEYFAGKNAGHDAAMSVQGVSARPLPIGVRRQLTLLGWYEYPRLARAFSPDAMARLAGERTEARLRQSDAGAWVLTDVEEFKFRAGLPWTRKASFDSAAARPVAIRVEALHGVAQSRGGAPLLAAGDFAKMEHSSAGGVSHSFAADAKGERGPAFRLSASNLSAPCTGSWARAVRRFDFPGLNVGQRRMAFGAWVKGDGSGALLNLQVTSPGEYVGGVSDHHVRLDFAGWKYVTCLLRERDAGEYWKNAWPYNGGYAAGYRNWVKFDHVATFAAYLNDVPKGRTATVEVGAVEAFETDAAAEFENASVSVNGASIPVPFRMSGGEYAELDGGTWTHYSAMGRRIATRPADARPAFRAGRNEVAFLAPDGARAELTLFALSNSRPAFRAGLSAAELKGLRHEAVMPFEYAPAKGLTPPKVLPVRSGGVARLEIEVSGPVRNPSFAFPADGGAERKFTFAADVAAGETLVCRDGRNWKVVSAGDGRTLREGALDAEMPLLDRSVPLAFSGDVPDGAACEVDLMKEYR